MMLVTNGMVENSDLDLKLDIENYLENYIEEVRKENQENIQEDTTNGEMEVQKL